MRTFVFWTLTTLAAIWGQYFLTGVDLLAPAFLVSLQEERPAVNFWLCLAWILLQEGMGSLAFGAGVLFYVSMALLFWVGRWMFEAKNFLFVCLLGVFSGLLHGSIALVMGILQDAAIPPSWMISTSLWQTLCFIVGWVVVSRLYAMQVKAHAHTLSG